MQAIREAIAQAAHTIYDQTVTVELTRPAEQFGDFATSIAMQLAGPVGQPPRDIAARLAEELRGQPQVAEVTVAGPGFINIKLADSVLLEGAAAAATTKPDLFKDQVVVTEYSDPNPFKALHAGHLYTTIVGDVISNLIAASGARVSRANFGGDVGPHVARAMWGIMHDPATGKLEEDQAWAHMQELAARPLPERAQWITERYVIGNTAYTEGGAKEAIQDINRRVYDLHAEDQHEGAFAQIYWTGRQWSYDYFRQLYDELAVHQFDKYYPESQTAPLGIQTVTGQLERGVYERSDGAIVFRGEPYGLHTRVFINSQGLPTYEAKDVGLIMKKWQDYHFDLSLVITGNDIIEYMKVVLKSIEQFEPDLAHRSRHLTHGMIKLEGGVKMSSRLGNVLLASDITSAAHAAAEQAAPATAHVTAISAVKYALLKQRLGADIIYNPSESVSLDGNSGPYLQYAHARARSILSKLGNQPAAVTGDVTLDQHERRLARKLTEYPEVLEKATAEFLPHYVCTYLYELAQVFNRFYENSRVAGDPREAVRARLVADYAEVLRDGLTLLGIQAPDRL
jgi:arginyl-tRNA synthetase